MFFAVGADIPLGRFNAPRIEAELVFVLAKPLRGPSVTLAEVLDATAFVRPAIEIIDSRLEAVDAQTKGSRNVIDHVADFAACAGIIVGGAAMRPAQLDLRRVGAILSRNGVIEETGLAAAVLDHPGNAVAWLAHRLAADGRQIDAGVPVLAGAFTRPIAAGDVFDVGGIHR